MALKKHWFSGILWEGNRVAQGPRGLPGPPPLFGRGKCQNNAIAFFCHRGMPLSYSIFTLFGVGLVLKQHLFVDFSSFSPTPTRTKNSVHKILLLMSYVSLKRPNAIAPCRFWSFMREKPENKMVWSLFGVFTLERIIGFLLFHLRKVWPLFSGRENGDSFVEFWWGTLQPKIW